MSEKGKGRQRRSCPECGEPEDGCNNWGRDQENGRRLNAANLVNFQFTRIKSYVQSHHGAKTNINPRRLISFYTFPSLHCSLAYPSLIPCLELSPSLHLRRDTSPSTLPDHRILPILLPPPQQRAILLTRR